jgi:pilus assembly protein FimV
MHTNLNVNLPAHLKTERAPWRLTALVTAMGVLLSLVHVDVAALALGRVTALSALGEPLVATIEVPDINAEELASLKTSLASPETFRVAGMEYNPALASAQITLLKRSDGSNYLQLRSDKVVADPFINLVIDANWSNGRIVRNYTLLLDPPAAKQNEASVISAPVAVLPAPAAPVPTTTQALAPAVLATPNGETTGLSTTKPITSTQNRTSGVSNTSKQIKVEIGDTAGKIAANNLPNNVSLEQMLIALLQGNPQAFVSNNVNRLRAGAILDLPTQAQAEAIPTNEAKQSVIAQSKDFNSFRRKLAESAPSLASKSTNRVATGKIEAKVEDKKAAALTPDKLTLSKGGLKSGDKSAVAAKEDLEKIAKARQSKDDAARSAELAKNIYELNKVSNNTLSTTKPETKPTTAPAAANAPAVTPAPAATASSVTPKPAVVAQAPAIAPPNVEPSVLDFLMDDPKVLPLAGGALALLLLGGLYASNKRKKRAAAMESEDDAWPESHFEEQSLFRETVNAPRTENLQRSAHTTEPVFKEVTPPVVTNVVSKSAASMPGTHTTLNPIAEADVYLGYDRDVQAEAILLDGLKEQPENTAIYTKLLGIYAKRRDVKKFEQTALKAKLLLSENSPQWLALCRQGLALEPQNLLYKAGISESENHSESMSVSEFATHTVAQLDPLATKSPVSVDLDLDFNFASKFPTNSVNKTTESAKSLADFPDISLESTARSAAPSSAVSASDTHALRASANNAMEFDLGHLSLDLNNSDPKATPLSDHKTTNPLETKLALANEFYAIGDKSGAKMLANEVLALATGSLKARAETLLANIG